MRKLLPCLFFLLIAGFGWAEDAPYEPDANAARAEVPETFRWDLTPIFNDDRVWRSSMKRLAGELDGLARFRGALDDPLRLQQCLTAYFDLHDQINHCSLYANLKVAVAQDDDVAGSMETQALALLDELMQRATFIRRELLAIDDAALEQAYEKQPGLAVYRPYIDNLRRRKDRVLSAESERILGLMGDNLWAEIDLNEIPSGHESAFQALLTDIRWPVVRDEEGNKVQMTLASYSRFRGSPDREVRKQAVQAFLSTLRQHQHVFAATLAGQYELSVSLAQARGYETAIDAYLDKDALTPAVYDNLIETVNLNLQPLHRYMALRRKAMGLEDLHLYDLYRPLTEGVEREIDFDEARARLMEALTPLGPDYLALLESGMDPANGWIDIYPHAGKRSGAFSASVYGVHPYVFMNFQNSQDDMSTLAHEYGHAAHSHLAMTRQPYSSFRYAPFLAEIASTVNEALLSDYLIANASDETERAYLLADRLETIRTTIYRQTMFAEFERTVHGYVEAKTPVTATLLDRTYTELVERYYGPAYTVDANDGMEWAYVPHFYYKYYVFNYATGLASGIAIADELRGDNAEAAQQGLIAMLSGGNSEAPLDLLKKAGVDLTEPRAIEAALALFARTVDELEKLVE